MNTPSTTRALRVLLVDDNPGDLHLTQAALATCETPHRLAVARDGTEAMAMLHREGDHAGHELPDLVLLDLHMPKMNGLEVLMEVKQDPALQHIPVVVMSSSTSKKEILETYERHANCYVTKPVNLDQSRAIIKSIVDFWFTTVTLPPKASVDSGFTVESQAMPVLS